VEREGESREIGEDKGKRGEGKREEGRGKEGDRGRQREERGRGERGRTAERKGGRKEGRKGPEYLQSKHTPPDWGPGTVCGHIW
jgi:hypothetical protein